MYSQFIIINPDGVEHSEHQSEVEAINAMVSAVKDARDHNESVNYRLEGFDPLFKRWETLYRATLTPKNKIQLHC